MGCYAKLFTYADKLYHGIIEHDCRHRYTPCNYREACNLNMSVSACVYGQQWNQHIMGSFDSDPSVGKKALTQNISSEVEKSLNEICFIYFKRSVYLDTWIICLTTPTNTKKLRYFQNAPKIFCTVP